MSGRSRPAGKQQGWDSNSGVWLQSRLSPALGHLPLAVPGGIAAESLTFTPLEDTAFRKWEEPREPEGPVTQDSPVEPGHRQACVQVLLSLSACGLRPQPALQGLVAPLREWQRPLSRPL